MRKIFLLFLVITALLVFTLGVAIADTISIEPWIRHHTTEILITHDDNLTDEKIIAHFRKVQEQYGVNMLQVIWRNMGRSISIYTTDTTIDGEISLSAGFFPVQLSDGFLSNKQTSDALQAGNFHFFTTRDIEVLIYPIEALAEQAGLGGIFFLNTTDGEIINQIIRYLEESLVGSVQVRATYDALSYLSIFAWTAGENSPLMTLIGIVSILFATLAVNYILSMIKQSALLYIEGYSKKRIVLEHLLEVLPMLLLSFMLISVCILGYLTLSSKTYFLWMFIRNNIIFHGVVLALFTLTASILIEFLIFEKKAVKIIAGRRLDACLAIMYFSAKYAVLIMIAVSFLQFQVQLTYLQDRQKADLNWWQTENVYTTTMRVASNMECLVSGRPEEINSKHLFEELSEELDLFLMGASNFQQMHDGRYLWEWNATDDFRTIHSRNGRSIVINENYLYRHPVYATDGLLAKEHLVYDRLVQNVLVPASLSAYAFDIYQTFLQDFYFASVRIPNFYSRELGQPADNILIEQLSINIIFVEDGTQYFTYNPRLATTTHNVITDPIVVVDTLNLDASFYYAWLSNSVFFESSGGNPLEELRYYVVRNNMGTALSNVNSVFDLHVESIRETEENLRILILVGIVLLAVFIFSIYTFIASYYEQHKYAIYLKRLFGYSKIRCNWHMLVFGTSLTTLILLLFPIAWYIITILVAIDILLIMIFNNVIGRKSFSEIVKGVH